MNPTDLEKQAAAQAAAELVESGMRVGLGTGSTVGFLLQALADRSISIECVSTSPQTEQLARSLGLVVHSFSGVDGIGHLDIAIDGADQVDPAGWIIKGGGAAHTREKCVAAAADRFIVIVSHEKLVSRLSAPVPLELLNFGLAATLANLETVQLRDVPPSPDGGIIADWTGDVSDPGALAATLSATPGVIDHGLFAPDMTERVVVAQGTTTRHIMIKG
ncbi:MAG: ribose 5-phosphate isomerase A [Actinomycetes bacterium]|jgi:ribose 5-phosphate isomerase A